MLLGSYLTLLIGPTVAVPAPPSLLESLQRIEVTHDDSGQSGFQIVFSVGRSGPTDLLDFALVSNPLLKVFNRVIMVVTMSTIPTVLMDGIITHLELNPSAEPGNLP